MRTWSVEVQSEAVRPHRLDERVLTSVAEALDADSRAFDSDVVGEHHGVRARFDVCAPDEVAAVMQARAIVVAAIARAAGLDRQRVRLAVAAREHVSH